MASWQNPPNKGYYQGQQGEPYPPNAGYPPPPGGYPPPQGGYPPPPGAYPPPVGGYPPPQFSAGGNPASGPYFQDPPAPGFIPPGQPNMYSTDYQEDIGGVKGFEFSNKSIRHGFIRKVYSILMLQLLITVGMIALFVYHEGTKKWVQVHPEMFWVCFASTIVLLICMACCTGVRRKTPMNFIFLFLFTIAEGFMLATAASIYEANEVLLAVGITAAVCLGLTLFAFQTKWDFTVLNGFLFVALLVFVIFGLIAMFFHGKTIRLVYAAVGALLFSLYLVYDTQLMIGGTHKYTISPEEYIFAALNLYIDVVNIFLYVLSMIGATRD